MPALGADMETGKVVQWRVQAGSRVKPGDVVAVVETYKGAIDVEIFLEGVIEDLAPLGADLRVGAVLAHVRGEASAAPMPPAAPPGTTPTPTPTAVRPPAPTAPAMPMPVRAPAPSLAGAGRPRVSPAARARARELGVDPERLVGTGVDGSVTLQDVMHAQPQPTPAPPAVPAPVVPKAGFDAQQMRMAIASSMGRSKREIPHYYLTSSIDFGPAASWLASYNCERPPAQRLLPAALLLKATARALTAVPQLNGFYEQGRFRPGAGIHVGWAVALRGGGLIAPAVHDADRKGLAQLMSELRDLVQRARTGGLRSSELTDPTITVTSLGERGADTVLGIIYPPQVAIVGFGRLVERPWVVNGQVAARPVLAVSLAADHRASDGHVGGLLLAAIDQALQQPEAL